MWMLPLYLHVNQKSDYDVDGKENKGWGVRGGGKWGITQCTKSPYTICGQCRPNQPNLGKIYTCQKTCSIWQKF